jgi:hypothetical protein
MIFEVLTASNPKAEKFWDGTKSSLVDRYHFAGSIYPAEGSIRFFRNFTAYLTNYITSHPIRD